MSAPQVPPEEVVGLIQILTLKKATFDELLAAFNETPPVMRGGELAAVVGSKIRSIPKPELKQILETLLGMSVARLENDSTVSTFVEFVCQAIDHSDDDRLKLTGKDRKNFRNRLTQLLSLEPLLYPAKGFGVMYDQDRLFLRARALTDIRPVVGSDVNEPPKAATIVHTLKIVHRHNDREKNFHVAMDSQDVKSLIDVLQRALSKADSFKRLLKSAKIAHLDSE